MQLKNYKKIVEETPEEINFFVEDSMNILDRIQELLELKFNGKQKLLAERLGKSESEVSKMLKGVQNFTLLTLSKLRAAFDGERIIGVITNGATGEFVQIISGLNQGYTRMCVNKDSGLHTEYFTPSTPPKAHQQENNNAIV